MEDSKLPCKLNEVGDIVWADGEKTIIYDCSTQLAEFLVKACNLHDGLVDSVKWWQEKVDVLERSLHSRELDYTGLQTKLAASKATADLHDELVKALRHFCKSCSDPDPTKDCDMCKTAELLAKCKEIK